MNKYILLFLTVFIPVLVGALHPQKEKFVSAEMVGKGIAVGYPGDEGIEKHQSVVFTEKFESGTLEEILKNWTSNRGAEDEGLALDAITGPDGSPGNRSLKMTNFRNKETGSELRKILENGYDQLFFRFYVKFAEDFGFNHHFTSIDGDLNPTPWPKGGAGLRPVDRFNITIDQDLKSPDGAETTPPGYWMFYSYWPEMHSWQTEEGKPDGRPNPYYGNVFMPKKPVAAKRGEWQCIEIMIRLNSSPHKTDGAQAFWVDGKLAGSWDPLDEKPTEGYWFRGTFRTDSFGELKPFTGIKWRDSQNPSDFDKTKINIIRLQNYLSENSWKQAEKYVMEHPGFIINMNEATVWKDHIVVATEYIGPIAGRK
jgi:hypothetical protein